MLAINLLRHILWLLIFYTDYSNRQIARLNNCSHPYVGKLRSKLNLLKLSWQSIDELSDSELRAKFYPRLNNRKTSKTLPDIDEVIKQKRYPRKQRKSLAVLFIEYRIKHGLNGYKKSSFYNITNQRVNNLNCTMKQRYEAGEVMFIDYLGTKAKCTQNGSIVQYPVFVACLGYSKKLFVFATHDMKSHSWTLAIIKAFSYFGGVPEVIQSDNAKAMVTKAQIIAVLNDNIIALSQHYGFICDTSRVGTPKDNANAENGAKITTSQIVAPMNQDLTFFSIEEVNAHLLSEIELINNQPFQKQDFSRNDLYERAEKKALLPLPLKQYIPIVEKKSVIVPSTSYVSHKKHEYSVPYTLNSKRISVRITADEILCFYNHKEVAKHKLSDEKGGFTCLTEHMNPRQQAEERKTKSVFMDWAKGIGPEAEALIQKQYAKTSNPSSRAIGKRCIVLKNLEAKFGSEAFLKACRYVIDRNAEDLLDPTDIELVIRAKAYEHDDVPQEILHANVRGSQYFEGGRHEH
jgi:transposase